MRDVSQRMRDLSDSCASAGLDDRQSNEGVGVFIPMRNIETWLRFLEGQQVDETTDYRPRHGSVVGCKAHARRLREFCQAGLPEASPSSLHAACEDFVKLEL
jgi:hypothetical protein